MPEFITRTIGDFLSDMARDYPDTEALVYADRGLRWTYPQFNAACERAARGFMKLGIKKGDHVAIWATNYPEWITALFAAAKIGAVLVTVNTNYKIFELEYLMRQSDSGTLILMEGLKDTNYVHILNELLPGLKDSAPGEFSSPVLPKLRNVVFLGDTAHPGMITWNDMVAAGDSVPQSELEARGRELDCHDIINMQYTSGTTGFPKGVMLTHHNLLNNGNAIGDGMKFTHKDRLCIPVPFFHCFGSVLAIMAAVTHATTMVPIVAFNALEVLETVEKERCTAVHGVPTMFIFMLEHPRFREFDVSSLRTGIMAGSLCPIKVMKQVVDDMGMKDIIIVFGQTESSPGITLSSTDDPIELRVSTVGRPFPGVEVKLVDPNTGKTVGPGVQGEICCRGYNVMKGYYNMEEATRAAIDADGFLHTGDLGMVDENGYYRVTGRIKDMIIRGGENIYPREIEELFYQNDKVQDVQIVGVPSKKYGEEVCAFVILKEKGSMDEDEAKQYVRERMSRHKVPSYVRFIDEFPMTASGKIQKFKLRERAVEELGLHGEMSGEE